MGGKKNRNSAKARAKKERLAALAREDAEIKAKISSANFVAVENGDGGASKTHVSPRNVLDLVPALTAYKRNGLECSIEFFAPGVALEYPSGDLVEDMIDLNEKNMKEIYNLASGEGWNRAAKKRDMVDESSRFFIAFDAERSIVGYVNVRFIIEGNCCVAYVYDVQVRQESSRKGLGKWLMMIVELIARKLDLGWVMLTVFNANKEGLKFFPEKLKYTVDETSPQFEAYGDTDDTPYVILSKNLKPQTQGECRPKLVQ